MMLEIENLQASINGTEILRGLSLRVNSGEVHAIMGPNGSGKSTLAQVIAGNDAYEVTGGSIRYNNRDFISAAIRAAPSCRRGFLLAMHKTHIADSFASCPRRTALVITHNAIRC